MTVYVDDMHRTPMGQVGRMRMSHMVADTDAELHAMADRIGVARRWWQGPPRHDSHYDIAIGARRAAVAAGAREVTMRQLAMMVRYRRERPGPLPDPDRVAALLAPPALSPHERTVNDA